MKDLKPIIARNIAELRLRENMTQSELAEKLNYSDKAVSKWERGESLPDISVLTEIADIFGVTLDFLVRDVSVNNGEAFEEPKKKRRNNRVIITVISMLGVLLIATWVFSVFDMLPERINSHWLVFVYAVPLAMVVWLVFNSIWFNIKRNYLIISLLMWSGFLAIYLNLLVYKHNFWQLFVVGIPAQAIIFAWSNLNYRPSFKRKKLKAKKYKKREEK